jgi:thiol-disulfide isomerase/thioredoxin
MYYIKMESISSNLISAKKSFVSSNLKPIMGVVGLILVSVLVYYFMKKKESYQNDKDQIRVVLFHVSWCPHCKNFLPEWSKLGDSINLDNNNCKVIEERCDEKGNEDAPQRYAVADRIEGYPTIFLFKGTDTYEYGGPRKSDDIVKWVKDKCN